MLKITKNQGSIQVTADKSGFYPFDGTITFPTNSLFTATSANTDMITFKSTSNGDVQFVGNYKDITISGRSYDTKQKFLTAFSNLANQGSVDAYTKAETDAKFVDKLTVCTNAKGSLFINSRSNDEVDYSVALHSSYVNGNGDVAIGLARTWDKKGYLNLAILNNAEANGIQNIAIGDNRRCDGTKNVSIGSGRDDINTPDVNGTGNVCIGESSWVHTPTPDNAAVNNSIAIGSAATASSNFCTVIGNSAKAKSSHAVAVGDNAYVEHDCDSSVAVGNSARAYGKGSVAIGTVSYANNDKPLDICCGQKTDGTPLNVIQSDANGKISLLKGDGTDERMVIQDEIEALKNAGGSGGTVDAYTKTETDTKLEAKQDKLTAGSGITITKDETAGTSTIATAVSLTDNGEGAYTVGDSIKMGNVIAIGSKANDTGGRSVVIGNNTATNYGCVAIGHNAQATSSFCTVIGDYAVSYGSSNTGVGNGVLFSNGSHSCIAIGDSAEATDYGSVSIGIMSKADGNTPFVIKAGYKTVDNVKQPLTVLQSDSTGKLSILKGDGTDERIVIQDALSAGGSGGTVDAYTKTETDALLNTKQNTLTAGTGITIDENNVISSTGGSGGGENPLVNVKGTGSATIPDDVTDAIAIGSDATAEKIYCISVGYGSRTNDSSVAIGSRSRGLGSSSVAIGSSTGAVGGSVGIGAVASASGNHSVAIGNRANATDANCVAIGYWVTATTNMPLVIGAGSRANGTVLPMIQGDANGKISLLKGDGTDERMVIQDEIEALKNAGGGGTVDAYTKAETDTKLDAKQDKLTAGSGITIDENNVISSTGGSGGSANPYVNVKGTNGNATIADDVTDAVAIGSGASVTKKNSVAIGNGATSGSGTSNVAIGLLANSSGGTSIAIGKNAETSNINTIAIGTLAGAGIPKSIAIGYNAKTSTNIPMVINAGGKTMFQGDKNGKISIPLGDGTASTMCLQDEIAALKAEIAALKGGASTGDASGDTTGA